MSQETAGPSGGTPSLHNTTYNKEVVVVQWDSYYSLTVAVAHLESQSQLVGPRGWYGELRALEDLLSVLRSNEAMQILYATHTLGIAWKGRIQRTTKGSKTNLYRQIDRLTSIGLLDRVPENHPELKAAIRIDKGRSSTTNFKVTGEAFMIAAPYVDVLSDIFRAHPEIIPARVSKLVAESLREVAKIKTQAEQMRLAFEKPDGTCNVTHCRQQAAINGRCAMHYQVMRGR